MQKEFTKVEHICSIVDLIHYEPRRGLLPNEVTNLHFYGTIILPSSERL